MVKRLALLLLVTTGLAGCAQGTSPSTRPATVPISLPASATVPPSTLPPSAVPPRDIPPSSRPAALPTRPTGPPKGPSDQIKQTDIVVGMVTKGGSGPCYGIATDDGTQYALHSTAGHQLPKGKYVRVRTAPSVLRIYCGPGRLLELIAVESIN
jgi:hypothetical protein